MNEIKHKMLKREIDRLGKKIERIDFILEARPASEIIKIREECQKYLDDNQGDIDIPKLKEMLNGIEQFKKREQYWFGIAAKQRNTLKLIDEKIELSSALRELHSDLFFFERRYENA